MRGLVLSMLFVALLGAPGVAEATGGPLPVYLVVQGGDRGPRALRTAVRDALVATLREREGIEVAPRDQSFGDVDAAAMRTGAIVIELVWSIRRGGGVDAALRARDPRGVWRSEGEMPDMTAAEGASEIARAILGEVVPAIDGLRVAYQREADDVVHEVEFVGGLWAAPPLWRGRPDYQLIGAGL